MTTQECIRQAKIDLTAALRAAAQLGLHEGVCNHFSYALPQDGPSQAFLINPQGIHWSAMVPADIVTVDAEGRKLDGHRDVEATAFFIHSQAHRSKPEARCILHTHMPYATALTVLEDGCLAWCSQNSLRYYGRVAYDPVYGGLALDADEGNRIAAALKNADVLFMANHGVLICGETIANAFDDLYYLERAAMVQIIAQSTGGKLRIIPDSIAKATAAQFDQDRQQSALHFEAIKRSLDAAHPGWSQG